MPNPLENELKKYPKCPYCGMDRAQYHHARHLVHYADDLVDGTCSIHCLAISLAINLDREPKAIYAAGQRQPAAVKPLINVDQATYLIGGKAPGVMTMRSKVSYDGKKEAPWPPRPRRRRASAISPPRSPPAMPTWPRTR
jgi:copper chaperone NosL